MIDDVKHLIEQLREPVWGESVRVVNDRLRTAALFLESLAAELEQVKQERDGLSILLGQAQSMLETRTRERDAAIRQLDADALSKEMLYRCNQEIVKNRTMRRALGDVGRAAFDSVKNALTIDAEPVRHGRWEQYPGPGYTRCTYCKLEFDERKMPIARDYCPNCGAKMDLKEE